MADAIDRLCQFIGTFEVLFWCLGFREGKFDTKNCSNDGCVVFMRAPKMAGKTKKYVVNHIYFVKMLKSSNNEFKTLQ